MASRQVIKWFEEKSALHKLQGKGLSVTRGKHPHRNSELLLMPVKCPFKCSEQPPTQVTAAVMAAGPTAGPAARLQATTCQGTSLT